MCGHQIRFIVEEKERLPAFIVKERTAEKDRQKQQQQRRKKKNNSNCAAKATKKQSATARAESAGPSSEQAVVVTATVNSDGAGDRREGKENGEGVEDLKEDRDGEKKMRGKNVVLSREEHSSRHAKAAEESRTSAAVKTEGTDVGRMTEWGNYIVDGQRKRGQKRKNLADDVDDDDYKEEKEEGEEEEGEEWQAKKRKRAREVKAEVEEVEEEEEETADDDPQDILEEAKIEVGGTSLRVVLKCTAHNLVASNVFCHCLPNQATVHHRVRLGMLELVIATVVCRGIVIVAYCSKRQ